MLGVFDTVVLAGILLASLAAGILLAHARRQRRADRGRRRDPGHRPDRACPPCCGPTAPRPRLAERLRPLVELLSELDLLAGADRGTLERLAAAAEEVVMPAGSVVIREGDEADALWILVQGELSVSASGDGPEPRELPPVTAPGYVGELGLLHGIPRTATVRTSQECTLLRIDGAGLPVRPGRPAGPSRLAASPWPEPVSPGTPDRGPGCPPSGHGRACLADEITPRP